MTLDEKTKRRLSTEADCDPRTLAKVARGERVRGNVAERARKVLDAHGLLAPAPTDVEREAKLAAIGPLKTAATAMADRLATGKGRS